MPLFEILRGFKRPLRALVYAFALDMVLTGMLGIALGLVVWVEGPWAQDYAGGLLGFSRFLLAVAAFGVLASSTHPWLMLRATRRLPDDPHQIDAYLASLAATAAMIAILLPTVGFVGAMMFHDAWFFIGLALVQAVPASLYWLTPSRRRKQEQLLRSRGVLVAQGG